MRRGIVAAMLFSCLALSGCTTFPGVKPIRPEVGHPAYPSTVDNLQPTFQWEAKPNVESYDFIIYEVLRTGVQRAPGRRVYYREGLQGTEHRVEEPLKPSTEYFWSLRIRSGSAVSQWSTYDYFIYAVIAWRRDRNYPFNFKTP